MFQRLGITMAAVTAADLCPPWLASVPRMQAVPPPASKDENWSNTAEGHPSWWRNLTRKLHDNGLAPMADTVRFFYCEKPDGVSRDIVEIKCGYN